MNINMSTQDNFSSYIDEKMGLAIFVDSFDNLKFEVRIGTTDESVSVGIVTAANDEELNKGILELVDQYKEKT